VIIISYSYEEIQKRIKEKKSDYYVVVTDWFNADTDKWYDKKPNRYYFFQYAENALNVASSIVHSKAVWEYYDKPKNVYLYGGTYKKGVSEDDIMLTGWYQISTPYYD